MNAPIVLQIGNFVKKTSKNQAKGNPLAASVEQVYKQLEALAVAAARDGMDSDAQAALWSAVNAAQYARLILARPEQSTTYRKLARRLYSVVMHMDDDARKAALRGRCVESFRHCNAKIRGYSLIAEQAASLALTMVRISSLHDQAIARATQTPKALQDGVLLVEALRSRRQILERGDRLLKTIGVGGTWNTGSVWLRKRRFENQHVI